MIIKGKVHKFGDDINTDEILPARFLNTSDAKELAQHCMEGVSPGFFQKVNPGDIIVAGKNFGCGSSREHAPVSIKACGISCVIAVSFARIFFRNAINIGLPILEVKAAEEIKGADILEVDLEQAKVRDLTRNKVYSANRFPEFMQELIRSAGLMRWVRRQIH